jgi:alpha-beta hydrolase superfamily lysophospholipase
VARPDLTRSDAPAPRAVVLLLHGGKEHSAQPVDRRSASWRRMAALQRAITPALHDAGASSWLLRYRTRGWDGGADKVEDARWALDQVRRELGPVPVVLLGHSMGGRTAVHVADDPQVVGVVALAPWFPPGEPVEALAGRALRAAHGRRDRITSYRATRGYVGRATAAGADATLTDMGWAGHYLLSRVGLWNAFAAEQSLILTGGLDRHR